MGKAIEMNERYKDRQHMVYQSSFQMDLWRNEHRRDAFDFLMFIANIGGFSLVL